MESWTLGPFRSFIFHFRICNTMLIVQLLNRLEDFCRLKAPNLKFQALQC